MDQYGISEAMRRRQAAHNKWVATFRHLPVERQLWILTSYIPIDRLEEIAAMAEKSHGQ